MPIRNPLALFDVAMTAWRPDPLLPLDCSFRAILAEHVLPRAAR
jgi:hypothetical protein